MPLSVVSLPPGVEHFNLSAEHTMATSLQDVGKQVSLFSQVFLL